MNPLRKQVLQPFSGPVNPLPEDPKISTPGENEITQWQGEPTADDESCMEEPTFIYDEGRFISHEELIERFQDWKTSAGPA